MKTNELTEDERIILRTIMRVVQNCERSEHDAILVTATLLGVSVGAVEAVMDKMACWAVLWMAGENGDDRSVNHGLGKSKI